MSGLGDLVEEAKNEGGEAVKTGTSEAMEKAKGGDFHGAVSSLETNWSTMEPEEKQKAMEKFEEEKTKFEAEGKEVPQEIKDRLEKLKGSL